MRVRAVHIYLIQFCLQMICLVNHMLRLVLKPIKGSNIVACFARLRTTSFFSSSEDSKRSPQQGLFREVCVKLELGLTSNLSVIGLMRFADFSSGGASKVSLVT